MEPLGSEDGTELAEIGVGDVADYSVRVTFRNIYFRVVTREDTTLEILKNISGHCLPGRVLSIMGPSGAGKTTLLDILVGNIYGGKVSGVVEVNGAPTNLMRLKRLSCYVLQNPALLAAATVQEALMTSALLRLPGSMPYKRKKELVDGLLEELGLIDCANTLIGSDTEGIKGISGGQKRRLSVGTELVTNPRVLVLDEPTSGLDSEIALTIMTTLKELASRGRTVVLTIHQPNSDIVDTFDDFMLLCSGRCIYFGEWKDAVDWFGGAGYQCPMYKNPADFFLGMIKTKEVITELADKFEADMTKALEADGVQLEVNENGAGKKGKPVVGPEPAPAGVMYQAWVLWIRFMRTWCRHPLMFWAEFGQYIFSGVFIGLMYLRIDDSLNGVFDRYASQFFTLVTLIFTPAFTAATVWDSERLLLRTETNRGAYHLTSYYIAKTCSTWPWEILFCLSFSSIVYFMAGYQADVGKFFIYWVVFVVFQLISEEMGLLAAVLTQKSTYALIILEVVLLIFISFTGFIVRDIPVYFEWVKKISYLSLASAALLENELKGLSLNHEGVEVSGDDLLGNIQLDNPVIEETRKQVNNLNNSISIGENIAALLAILVGLRILVLVALKVYAVQRWL